MTDKNAAVRFAFFGTAPLSGHILDALSGTGLEPSLIVSGPDSVDARKKTPVFPPEKIWGLARGIQVVQPSKIDKEFIRMISQSEWDTFVVASYGKILPKALLEIPKHGVLNVHPSLLPRLRGPSPIRSAILTDERETGVSIIVLDDQLDHGPIIAQKRVIVPGWSHPPKPGEAGPPRGRGLDELLAREGGTLLAEYLPKWVKGEIESHEQNHDLATFCGFIKKEDGRIDLRADAYQNLLKIRAYDGWPGTYAIFRSGDIEIRVKILDAHIEGSSLKIDRVLPAGKREMSYEDFLRSGATPL
jgi:methionyl-tRNA formyltransferase